MDSRKDHFDTIFEQVRPGCAAALEVVKELNADGVPIGSKLVIEHRAPEPQVMQRVERMMRNHTFNRLKDFSDYLLRYGAQQNVVIVIDINNQTAMAAINEAAEHEVERIIYKPLETAAFKRIKDGMARHGLTQFISFLRENRAYIVPEQQSELRMLTGQLKVTKAIESYEGVGPRDTFGEVVKLTFKGKQGGEDRVEIPEVIHFRVKPFVDSPSELLLEVFVDLKLPDGTSGAPVFSLSAPGISDMLYDAMVDAHSVLSDSTKGIDPLVGFGSLRTTNWNYVPVVEA